MRKIIPRRKSSTAIQKAIEQKQCRLASQTPGAILQHERVAVHHGDCLRVMAAMPEASVDSIITDPPYGLEFMGEEWDKLGAYQGPRIGEEKAHPAARKNRVRYGSSAASMQSWHEAWARAALRVAKPGAILMAFGGTRTFHRLACAVEDAGWELKDCIMWVYGSGFPKSHNISKAIDKEAGVEREKIGEPYMVPNDRVVNPQFIKAAGQRGEGDKSIEYQHTAPATEAAKTWDGWGTALKPSYEPILIAMKPLDGTFAGNAVEHGVAGLWIDGGRVGTEERILQSAGNDRGNASVFSKDSCGLKSGTEPHKVTGRWPANLILSHSEHCVLVGTTPDPGYVINRFVDGAKPFGDGAGHEYESDAVPGGEREVWACVPGCPVRILDEQSGATTSKPGKSRASRKPGRGYGMTHTGAEHADSGGASRFFYTAKASSTERLLGCPPGFQNRHPTVKPLDLCRYLCRLTRTPTGGVVLDPFSGSGSIAVAALLEGRTAIAIELEEESAQATVARVQAALEWGDKLQSLKKYKLPGRKKLKRRK